VIDDGEQNYTAHAYLAFSKPTDNFWALHDGVAARGDLYIAFEARGIFDKLAKPPFTRWRSNLGQQPPGLEMFT